MTAKQTPVRTEVDDREQRFEKLLVAMGLANADPWTRHAVTQRLEEIANNFARHLAALPEQPGRRVVEQYRSAIAKLLALSNEIGPEFFSYEVAKAGWSRQNPHADDETLNWLVAETGKEDEVVKALTQRELDVAHWLNSSGESYRKRDLSKLVIAPLLQLMSDQSITTDRKLLPRKHIFDAMFDWLGVEPRDRVTSANIGRIARDLDKVETSNKNQQPEN
jgi:ferritin-like metal-binding protein YciE